MDYLEKESYVFEHTTCRYFYIWLLKKNVDCPYNAWMSSSVIALIVTVDGICEYVLQIHSSSDTRLIDSEMKVPVLVIFCIIL